ncbi:MAG: hypothetical protein MUO26_02280 [Methanotrichaceae archaeon]|nr:hypothetical protein [Methanotrichaceae archaeon]
MIESVEQLDKVFQYLGTQLTRQCSVYLVGGAALMVHGLKDRTRDIDMCAYPQTTNQVISDLREADNLWTCNIGMDQFLFLRVFLDNQNITLEFFINEEYKRSGDCIAATRRYGDLEVNIPTVKKLIALKDIQIKGLIREVNRLQMETHGT